MVPGRRYNRGYIRGLLQRHWILLSLPFLLLVSGAVLIARALPDVFYSQATILIVPQRVPESYVRSTVTASIEDRLRTAQQQILSNAHLEELIEKYDLYAQTRHKVPRDLVIQWMRRSVTVQFVKADAFTIGYYGYDPKQVTQVAERLAQMFIEQNLQDREMLADSTSAFLDLELQQARDRLVEQENKVEGFRRKFAGELPSQLQTNLQMVQAAYGQLQGVLDALNRDRERRAAMEKDLQEAQAYWPPPPVEEVAAAPGPDDEHDPLKLPPGPASERLKAGRAAIAKMELRLTPNHPDVIRARSLLERIERQAEDEYTKKGEAVRDTRVRQSEDALARLDKQIAERQDQEKRLRDAIGTYRDRIEATPTRESDWASLTRDYATSQQIYTELLAKKEESKIAANLERRRIAEQFRIVDPPHVPARPSSPNRPGIVLFGLMIGLGLGCAFVAFSEVRDLSLRGEDEVAATLGLPVLGMLPVIVMPTEHRKVMIRRLCASAAFVLIAVAFVAWRWR